MGEITKHFGLGFKLNRLLTTQINDLEFYVELEKNETLTEWDQEAAAALNGAFWPKNGKAV
jgi:hypothetical protein